MPAAAQDFCILDNEGNPVENGGVIDFKEFVCIPVEFENPTTGEISYIGTNWLLDPELVLFTETAGNYTIEVSSNINDLRLCTLREAGNLATGTCETDKPVLTKSPVVMTSDDERDLHLTFEDQVPYEADATYDFPAINATIKVWNLENPDEVYSITLNMGGFEATAGVESLIDGGNSVVFAGNVLSYDLPSASSLNVYSLSGKVVVNKTVSGNGSISLANLPKGIYVYKISGKINKTAKIVIR